MNRTEHIGYLTRNVELKKSKNGEDVAKFTIAINRRKTKEGMETGTDYFDVVVFGQRAINCYTYLERGMRVGVCGHLRSGRYVSKRTGQTVKTVEIIAEDVDFLSFKNDKQEDPDDCDTEEMAQFEEAETGEAFEDEKLPFDKEEEELE